MRVLVTGANGFIGKNIVIRLREMGIKYDTFTRYNTKEDLAKFIKKSNFIFHFAGENRPADENDFISSNIELTSDICNEVKKSKKPISILFASSTQAVLDNAYGQSKMAAELSIKTLINTTNNKAFIYRLPGVFGKWAKNNYNSVVATFCYNTCRGLAIQVDNPDKLLKLVYIDDVVDEFISKLLAQDYSKTDFKVEPEYRVTLKEISDLIVKFRESRNLLSTEPVGRGFARKLYATYLSYLPPESFSYSIPAYSDERGIFSEILKTKDSGQFSFFTAKPGVTRGGHYHHSKTEKFLVVEGKAKFRFKNLITQKIHDVFTDSLELKIVETPPGWSHDITNIGNTKMIVILWASEIFNPKAPDTYAFQF